MILVLVLSIIMSYILWIKWIYHRHRVNGATSLKCLMGHLSNRDEQFPSSSPNNPDVRALIVTAHPDDESMFFAPTILRLIELEARVNVLCLSRGDFYNQGARREKELMKSCAVLGIPSSRVTLADHHDLPDDPNVEWSGSVVSSVIIKHIRAHSFNMVLTFDGRGVSGHANHIAIHRSLRHLASTGQVCADCCLLSLVTVGVLRKYLSCLELPLSWLTPSCLCCVVGVQGYRRAREAMLCHRTQLLWFRRLYVFFSRYMLVNTFQTIPQGPKNIR